MLVNIVPTHTAPLRAGPITLCATDDLLEVRLLGLFQVRRRDGSCVDEREWRTGKTADLLRLLALSDGAAVPVDVLLEELWPDVDEAHGRASLRTAASQLRTVLGADAVERGPGGMALVGAWVDVAVYARISLEAQRKARRGEHAGCVRSVLEAEALRLGPVAVHEPGAAGVGRARDEHAALRQRLLLAGAEGALTLGWLADASELASRVLEQDPASEQASRTYMRACAHLGAVERSLREFDRCRRVLADELGVDPSPATQELHLELLAGSGGPPPWGPVPRRRESDWLLTLLHGASRTSAPLTVHLVGDTAGARRDLLTDVCATAGARLVAACSVAGGVGRLSTDMQDLQVLHVEDDDDQAAWLPATATNAVLVLGADTRPATPTGVVVDLRPLLREELNLLAELVLGDRPDPALVAVLAEQCGGSHSQAARTLQGWLRDGRVHSTGRGMVLLEGSGVVGQAAERSSMARTAARLSPLDQEVLSTIAVLDRSATPDELARLLTDPDGEGDGPPRRDLERTLCHLADLGLLRSADGGQVLRDPLLADAIRSWVRRSTLRRLHRAIAERGLISSAERVVHWLAIGETELACAAALEAADAAISEDRHEDARTHLLQVCSLADVQVDLSTDGSDLARQLGRVLEQLGRPEDAWRARRAVSASPPQPLHTLPTAVVGCVTTPVSPASRRSRREDVAHLVPPACNVEQSTRAGSDQPAEPLRRRQHDQALADAHLPAALRSGGSCARLTPHLVELLLGGAGRAEQGLLRLQSARPAGSSPELTAGLDLLLTLAVHDLGQPGADVDAGRLDALVERAGPDWAWLPVRLLVERYDLVGAQLAECTAASHAAGTDDSSELGAQLLLLATSTLRAEQNGAAAAIPGLIELVERAVSSGCTLLLPEAAALLARAEAREGGSSAREHFDLFEWSTGAQNPPPRASTLRLLARAELRSAGGDHRRAAAAAAQAAALAGASGLAMLAAHALLSRARHLIAEGSAESVTVMTQARDAFHAVAVQLPALRRPGVRPVATVAAPALTLTSLRSRAGVPVA